MRKQIENLIGYLCILMLFLGGVGLCGYFIYQNQERQEGALALAIGLGLLYAGWLWATKDRSDYVGGAALAEVAQPDLDVDVRQAGEVD